MTENERQPDATPAPHQTTTRDPTGIHYSDGDGVRWRVREVQRADSAPALYFESEIAFRRVTRYPADWQELTAAELDALSHGR